MRFRCKCWGRILAVLTGLLAGTLFRGFCSNNAISSLQYNVPSSPPTFSTDSKKLLFVGVLTAHKYLPTRASAVYRTWGQTVPIAFFTSETSVSTDPTLPLVPLKGVDDSYPPQKKSFLMLQYMWEHYGNTFEWFLRADDDVYVRTDRLMNFLRSIDSQQALFIGQAGRGNREEFGLLSLEYDENFCMGGPGVLLSRETLARIAPHIKDCLKNLYTQHEDVELGRCVKKYAGVSCTWSYEMQTILYHNSSGDEAFTGNLKQKEVHRAITLHPVKKHENMYRVHNYIKMLKIQETRQDVIQLYRDVFGMKILIENFKNNSESSNRLLSSDIELLGQPPGLNKYKVNVEEEIINWDFIERSLYSSTQTTPKRRIEAPLKEGLEDVSREVMEAINMFSKQRGRIIEFKDILYGYHRYNPLFGADYILDMLLIYKKYRGKKVTMPARRHAYLQQQFTGIEIRELNEIEDYQSVMDNEYKNYNMDDNNSDGNKEIIDNDLIKIGHNSDLGIDLLFKKQNSSKKIINFIVPLSGRFFTLARFLKNFEIECLSKQEPVTLTIILFPNRNENSVQETIDLVNKLQYKYSYAKISVIPQFEIFARGKALEIGSNHIKEPNDLLFFIDVDMVFLNPLLQRIRSHTIRNRQVYYPIVYSEFDPIIVYNSTESPNHFLIDQNSGYWRQYGFGIASMYKSDFKQIGGFNTSIIGWGKEDVDLFDKFILRLSELNNFTIFRSIDPDLVHVFHIVDCDPRLDVVQFKMCHATRADTYGNSFQLAKYFLNFS